MLETDSFDSRSVCALNSVVKLKVLNSSSLKLKHNDTHYRATYTNQSIMLYIVLWYISEERPLIMLS